MLHFFRHIRRSFFQPGKVRTYLAYAFGEIVLIVVGILIALQVSDWNEARKLKKVEILKLTEISKALSDSAQNLEDGIAEEKRWMGYNQTIQDHLNNRKPYHEGLDICFGSYYWNVVLQFPRSAFDQLKSSGLEIISNAEIRERIAYIYDVRFDLVQSENQEWDWQFLSNVLLPMDVQLFRNYFPEDSRATEDEFAKPLDYEALLDNEVYKNVLGEIMSGRRWNIAFNEEILKEVYQLIEAINLEVEKLKN